MDKWTIKLRDGLKDATGFQQSLDTLYEVVQDLGFTQVLYARQVVNPRLSEHE